MEMELLRCKCQFCGNSHNFVEAVQEGYARVSYSAFGSQPLYHLICLDCGSVVRSYIKKPEKAQKHKLSECY